MILDDARHRLVRLFLQHLHRTLPPRYIVFKGFEPKEILDSESSHDVKVYSVEVCYMAQTQNGNFHTNCGSSLRERLAFRSPPFTKNGIDYFRPSHASVERSTKKKSGYLFKCLTTRAVHFEVASSMDTSSCFMGIDRFVARRGLPGVMWLENSTNFTAIEKELNNILNMKQQTLTNSIGEKGKKWKLNPPGAPHHGDVWERLLSSFKHTFYAILGNRRLTDENLQYFL